MNFFKYFSATVFAALALVACDGKKELSYVPADPVAPGQRVFFASASESFEVRDNSASVSIDIYRPESEVASAQIVELEVDDPSGLFSVPATVTIPAGQVSAPVEIAYNWQSLEEDETYDLDIAISEVFANQYALSSTNVSITRSNWTDWVPYPSPYKVKGLGLYTFSDFYLQGEAQFILKSRTNLKDSNRIQYSLGGYEDPKDASSWYDFLILNSDDGGNVVTIPAQPVAVDPDYGTVYMSSVFLYPNYDAYGLPPGESVFDKATGLITLNVIYFDNDGPWNAGNEYFQLYGYESADDEDAPAEVRRRSISSNKPARISKALKF